MLRLFRAWWWRYLNPPCRRAGVRGEAHYDEPLGIFVCDCTGPNGCYGYHEL